MMKKEVLPLLAMPAFLLFSYGLDVVTAAIKAYSSSTFKVMAATCGHVLVEFVFAGAVILLVWLVVTKHENKLLIGWLFFAVGLIALFISTPFRIYFGYFWNAVPVLHRGWLYHFWLSFNSYGFFTKAGALIVVLGLVELLRKPR
jgi:hypothetical protein